MDLSHFLAKVMGSYMLIMAVLWLMRKDQLVMAVRNISSSSGTHSLFGIIQIIFGLMIVISHSVWTFDWKGLITLFGYLALIQGVLRLAFPSESAKYLVDFVEKGYGALVGIAVLFGIILAYNGFTGG